MELSAKAIRYVVESLKHYRDYHDQRLENDTLSDDETSDLINDREFLTTIIEEIQSRPENSNARQTA